MAVTLLGTTPLHGIASAQSGILLESQDEDWTISEKYHLGLQGEAEGLVLNNALCNITLTGEVPSSSPFSARMGATLALANAAYAGANGSGALATGNTIIMGVRRALGRDSFATYTISLRGHPNFPA